MGKQGQSRTKDRNEELGRQGKYAEGNKKNSDKKKK
ncbi:hypothetical protein BN983_00788 [Halobacillus karajensis]|uniref:Uncharacterized protein n=1 Tax=Halobacillus karajensis TaxID=195088 RepID=A0A059NW74_9BACI|nr:hypothetical protein BN983_00788 [Halobacillus karajensis]CDQ26057.1 hypothetical protein BN981_00268 [Halobacillus karajensis]